MTTEDKTYKFNRGIDRFIMSQTSWAIDVNWGIAQLNNYISEIETVSSGVIKFKHLRYAEKLHRQRGVAISCLGKQPQKFDLTSNDIPAGSFAHLRLNGVMRMEDGLSTRGVRQLCDEIKLCNQNPNITGILLEVNSGGGESAAGNFLNTTMKDSNIPVVVWGHLVGSAAVRGTLPAAHVVLSGTNAEIGSIGTMASIDKEYIDWYNDNYEDIYSSKSPDKNKWFRDLLKGDKKQLINELDNNVDSFHTDVLEYRKLPDATREQTLKGGMYMGNDAIERGLADSVGTFNDALQILADLASNSFNNKNNTSMKNFNFKTAYETVITKLNAFFGKDFKSDEGEEEVVDFFDTLGESFDSYVSAKFDTVQNLFNEKIAGFEKTVKQLTDQVKDLTEKNTGMVSKDDLDKLTEQVTELTKNNKKLAEEKTELEKAVAVLSGDTDIDENTETLAINSVSEFMDAVGNLKIEGKSKY